MQHIAPVLGKGWTPEEIIAIAKDLGLEASRRPEVLRHCKSMLPREHLPVLRKVISPD